jgi:hypothetical protein
MLEYQQVSVPLKLACPGVTHFIIPKVPQGAPKLLQLECAAATPVWVTHPLPATAEELQALINQLNMEHTV